MHQEIFEYALAVADHWFFWFGGIVLVVFELVKRIPRWKDRAEKSFSPAVFWGGAVVCMLIATFQAWRDEHIRVGQLSREKITLAARNDSLNEELIAKERPIVLQPAPNKEIEKLLKRQDEELAKLRTNLPSPKKKALLLSNDILKFLGDRMKEQPVSTIMRWGPKVDLQTRMNQDFQENLVWTRETRAQFGTKFAVRIADVIQDMKMAKLDIRPITGTCDAGNNTYMLQQCGAELGVMAQQLPE